MFAFSPIFLKTRERGKKELEQLPSSRVEAKSRDVNVNSPLNTSMDKEEKF